MRTTIRLDDELYRAVKTRAAATGRTVTAIIEDAIRVLLSDRAAVTGPLSPLPVHGGSGTLPGVDLTNSADLLEVVERDLSLDALR